MRLEILVGSNDPITYPFKSAKLFVGSADTCDIVINHQGVSRKHLLLSSENGKYFVIDQGSTNGTFINEERLIPGRKVEFTSFFPMRLGNDVLVSLLSEEEYIPVEETFIVSTSTKNQEDSSTRVISLKDLNQVKTDKLVKKRETKRAEVRKKAQSAPVKKKKRSLNFTQFVAVVIVLTAAYYNFFLMPKEAPEEVARVGEFVKDPDVKIAEEVKVDQVSKLIPETELTKYESFETLKNDLKCVTDFEKNLCESIPGANNPNFGAVQVGSMINVMVDASHEISIAKSHVTFMPDQPEDYNQKYNGLVKQVAAYKFLIDKIPSDLNYEMYKDLKLTFALYNFENDEYKLYIAIAVTPQALKEFKEVVQPDAFQALKQFDSDVENNLKKIYRIY